MITDKAETIPDSHVFALVLHSISAPLPLDDNRQNKRARQLWQYETSVTINIRTRIFSLTASLFGSNSNAAQVTR